MIFDKLMSIAQTFKGLKSLFALKSCDNSFQNDLDGLELLLLKMAVQRSTCSKSLE